MSFGITLLAIAWIGAPFAHAVLLRDLPLHGGALLVDVLVATFVADTAAYFGGRLFGRHPLAPSLSPNKTIEGLVAGFIGGTMGFWFAGLYQDWLTGVDALLMGAVHRDRRADGRPVRVDDQARPRRQGHRARVWAARRAARPPRRGAVHGRRGFYLSIALVY